MVQNWFRDHLTTFAGSILFDEPLARYTYYQIGGPAQVFAIPRTLNDLQWLKKGIEETGIPLFIMGQGSNLLVADEGYRGLVVRVNKLNLDLSLSSPSCLTAGGSVMVSSLLRRAAQEGWGGLEFLTGIPGSVGGAVKMNAGTHLGESQARLTHVTAFSLLEDGKVDFLPYEFSGDQLKFQYRKNLFLPEGRVIWNVGWKIESENPAVVQGRIDEVLKRRKATQPTDFPSCGSVFKNPKSSGMNAWQVIDRLGLRGYQIGMAQFAEKHSNFIINLGGARASDVLALIELAKARAEKELGIALEEEVVCLRTNLDHKA